MVRVGEQGSTFFVVVNAHIPHPFTVLYSLKVDKAAGVDKIPARLLRNAEVELARSITYLINKSITDGTVPAL